MPFFPLMKTYSADDQCAASFRIRVSTSSTRSGAVCSGTALFCAIALFLTQSGLLLLALLLREMILDLSNIVLSVPKSWSIEIMSINKPY